MRHLVGVILAIAMAAAVFFAASWGYLKLLTRPDRAVTTGGSLIHDHVLLEGLGALLLVGLLAGLLIAVPRISPLASGLPGVLLLAWTGLYLFSEQNAIRYVPLRTHAYGLGFELMLLDGVLAMAGAAFIIPLFVPSRWRRRPVTVIPAGAATATYPADAATTTYPAAWQSTQTMHADDLFSGSDPGTPTRPQPRIDPDNPETRSQAPWGPAEYS